MNNTLRERIAGTFLKDCDDCTQGLAIRSIPCGRKGFTNELCAYQLFKSDQLVKQAVEFQLSHTIKELRDKLGE